MHFIDPIISSHQCKEYCDYEAITLKDLKFMILKNKVEKEHNKKFIRDLTNHLRLEMERDIATLLIRL